MNYLDDVSCRLQPQSLGHFAKLCRDRILRFAKNLGYLSSNITLCKILRYLKLFREERSLQLWEADYVLSRTYTSERAIDFLQVQNGSIDIETKCIVGTKIATDKTICYSKLEIKFVWLTLGV